MLRILVTDGMDKRGIDELRNSGFEVIEKFYPPEELMEMVKDIDVIVVRSATKITREIIHSASMTKRLKLIIRAGVGIDNIDAKYGNECNIDVRNTPLASSISVAELTIGQMFSLARFTYISNVTMRQGKWNKKEYEGTELFGKTLGLIGFGRISLEVAKRALALGMKVIYTNRSGENTSYPEYKYLSFEQILSESDFISIHTPAMKDNQPLIGEAEIKKMKNGVFLINLARGGIVNEEALLNALDSGKVAGAALDVFTEEPIKNERLYKHDRIALTPHIGGSTKEAQERIGEEIVSIIKDYNKGR